MSLPSSVPEYQKPAPGERDSLDLLYARAEVLITELQEEAVLHVEMYPDDGFVSDLLVRLAHIRQGFQIVETAAEHRAAEVLG